MIKIIPKGEKKSKKAKWLPKDALQTAEKRTEVKDKGEKERYIYLNVEFQRTSRRYKEEFFGGQCKEIEENNRMGKTRGLFKKISDTQGTFGKLSSGYRTGKFSFHSNPKGKAMLKNAQTTTQLHSSHTLVK